MSISYTNLTNNGATNGVVDDLTTGGKTKALSANQGVILKDLIDQNTLTLRTEESYTHKPIESGYYKKVLPQLTMKRL